MSKKAVKPVTDEDISYLEKKYSSYNDKSDDKKKVKNAKGTALRFFSLLKPYKFSVAIVCLASILSTVANVISPDYLGNMLQIGKLSRICKKHGVLLAVDNAHGAYLNFLPIKMVI